MPRSRRSSTITVDDSSRIRTMKGGASTGPSPVDGAKTGRNRNDATRLIPLIEANPPIPGKRGQPRRRPRHPYTDRSYNREIHRYIARRGCGPQGLPLDRWRRHRAAALVPPPPHPLEIRDDIHQVFMTLGCAIICWRRLKTSHSDSSPQPR